MTSEESSNLVLRICPSPVRQWPSHGPDSGRDRAARRHCGSARQAHASLGRAATSGRGQKGQTNLRSCGRSCRREHGPRSLRYEIGAGRLAPAAAKEAITTVLVRAFDNVEGRKGYSGLYQFGVSYNPGKFTSPTSPTPRSVNYLLYWMASQALWRVNPKEAKGLDGTFAYDWSPPSINRNNTLLTAGLRFNEPLPLHIHNTMSLGYVRNSRAHSFLRLAWGRGRRSRALSSTLFWTFYQCSFYSL